jgi:hypothetical protein
MIVELEAKVGVSSALQGGTSASSQQLVSLQTNFTKPS